MPWNFKLCLRAHLVCVLWNRELEALPVLANSVPCFIVILTDNACWTPQNLTRIRAFPRWTYVSTTVNFLTTAATYPVIASLTLCDRLVLLPNNWVCPSILYHMPHTGLEAAFWHVASKPFEPGAWQSGWPLQQQAKWIWPFGTSSMCYVP